MRGKGKGAKEGKKKGRRGKIFYIRGLTSPRLAFPCPASHSPKGAQGKARAAAQV